MSTGIRLSQRLVLLLAMVSLLAAGCSTASGGTVPRLTPMPAAKSPATPAPSPRASPLALEEGARYPEAGRTISLVVPYPAGGSSDIASRLLAANLEEELGSPVRVVNKAGANGQIGYSELATARPDGYTVAYIVLPIMATLYLDDERGASFSSADFTPVAMQAIDANAIAVANESPFRNLKDLVSAGTARPEQLKAGVTSFLGPHHLNLVLLEQMSGAKFSPVQFDGGAPVLTALLGGHVDAAFHTVGNFAQQAKVGSIRILAVLDKEECSFVPGAPTAEAQGYRIHGSAYAGLAVPRGTPRRVVEVLDRAVAEVSRNSVYRRQMDDIGQKAEYLGPGAFGTQWAEVEAQVNKLLVLARQ